MLGTIIKKELHDNIVSVRFFLILLIVFGLMSSSGLLFVKKYRLLQEEYSEGFYNNRKELSSIKDRLSLLINFEQTMLMSPNSLRFLADGGETELPNSARLSIQSNIRSIKNIGTGNPFMDRLGDVDIVFIVKIILSFVALSLTFNAVCGEKESGTLRLSLSNPVPRDKLLLGKYISSMIILIIPFAIGLIINLLIITSSPSITFSNSQWIQAATIAIVSIIYISIFVLLGMTISSWTRSTPVSLVMLLLIWVIWVILIPNNWAGILSGKLTSIPTPAEIEAEADRANRAVWDSYPEEYMTNYEVGDLRNVQHVKVQMEAYDAYNKIYDNYRSEKIRIVDRVRMFTRISPASVYQYVTNISQLKNR